VAPRPGANRRPPRSIGELTEFGRLVTRDYLKPSHTEKETDDLNKSVFIFFTLLVRSLRTIRAKHLLETASTDESV
jgi:hypothetical protein